MITRRLNISPQEVKEAFYDHVAVLEVAVIGMPDPLPARGERVVAFVSLRDGVTANEGELREHASLRLADFKVPEQIFFVNDLPKGITGKIQRRALKQTTSTAVALGRRQLRKCFCGKESSAPTSRFSRCHRYRTM